MRLSVLRLWITAGFGVLVTELALLVFIYFRMSSEISSLQKEVEKLKQENARLSREMMTVNQKLGRGPGSGTSETAEEPEKKASPSVTEPTIGPADLVARFRKGVLDEDEAAERAAASELRGHGVRGIRALVAAYPSETAEVQRRMIALIGSIGDPEALSFLEAQLQASRDKATRLAILKGILQQPDKPTLSVHSTELATEQDADVLKELVRVVRKVDTDEAATALASKYDSLPEPDRADYLQQLAGFTRPGLRPFYERVLAESRNGTIRIACVRGLGETGTTSTIPLLERLVQGDPDEEVRREADKAIARIRG